MGTKQSTLEKMGYIVENETENPVVATKGDDKFLIKKIKLDQISGDEHQALMAEIEILKSIKHPHVVSYKNSFQEQSTYYAVMDYCQGGSLAAKIRKRRGTPEKSEVLSWIVEICMALKTVHEKGLLHKHLAPENVFLTEFGLVCLDSFGKKHQNSEDTLINYLAPEVFTEGTYDAKSDIWSVGCILYEICKKQKAFPEENPVELMPKILGGPYPSLPKEFSPDLCELLKDILNKDPESRPTASEIMAHPFMIGFLTEKCKTTVEELQNKLDKLRSVADGLERVHQGATIGSLAGGVFGVLGGVTSVVGLILAPFTLGASLIVTGVGVGVGTLGGVAAGASNITKMVNQSSDRKAVRDIIKEFGQKISAVVTWLQEIRSGLETFRDRYDSAGTLNTERSQLNEANLARLGCRAGRGLGGIAELVRLAQVINIGRIAAQTSRAVRVAEVATGVLSGLFVAVDIFFIAMDAREIHDIRQARAAEEKGATSFESVSEAENTDFVSTSDQGTLVPSSPMQESDESNAQHQSGPPHTAPIRSEIIKFVRSVREAADNLQEVLDELKCIISSIPPLKRKSEAEGTDKELLYPTANIRHYH